MFLNDYLKTKHDRNFLSGQDAKSHHMAEVKVYNGLRIYTITLLLLTAIAWCFAVVQGPMLHKAGLHRTLLCCPGFQFSDFYELTARVVHFGEPHMLSRGDYRVAYPNPVVIPYPYPVPTIYPFLFFVRLIPHPLAAYLIFIASSFFIATYLLAMRVKRISSSRLPEIAVWSTFLFGFPLLFLLDRANIEAVLWVLILLGVVAFTRNRLATAAILWSVAASMKIYPALLCVLFLAKRKYWIFGLAVASTALISVLALAGVGPTIQQAASESSATTSSFVVNGYILARQDLQFDHSLFAAVKQAAAAYIFLDMRRDQPDQRRQTETRTFKTIEPVYTILVPLGALLLYLLRLRHLPLLNQFIAYILLSVSLPFLSGDYTLIHVYVIWAAFLLFLLNDVATGRVEIPTWTINMILFSSAVCFVPLTYLGVHFHGNQYFGIGAQVKTIFLGVMLWAVIRTPMPSSLFGDLEVSQKIPL